jgi:MATE family multidrug resistance protein
MDTPFSDSQPSTLTRYKPGSLQEVWALTWPLMLSYLSLGIMLFTDRLFLAKLDATLLNAGSRASMAYLLISVIPTAVASISEVIVGKLNGARDHQKIGAVFWACWLLMLMMIPPSILAATQATAFIFTGESLEADYFRPLTLFLPFQVLSLALSGWYIGTGRVKIITYSTLIGACVNIFFDWVLIFGKCGFPCMGVAGAALGTGIAQTVQCLALIPLALFSKDYYSLYLTRRFKEHLPLLWTYVKEFWNIGFGLGLGQWFEMLGHNMFFYLITQMGQEQLTLTVMAQSLYLLVIFVGMSINKTSATICANAIGAKNLKVMDKALKNCFFFLTLAFFLMLVLFCGFTQNIMAAFLSKHDFLSLSSDPALMQSSFLTLLACCFFFYFDGLTWTLQGVLTAKSDTRIILWTSLGVYWGLVVAPLSLFVYFGWHYAHLGWALLTLATLVSSLILYTHHKTKAFSF